MTRHTQKGMNKWHLYASIIECWAIFIPCFHLLFKIVKLQGIQLVGKEVTSVSITFKCLIESTLHQTYSLYKLSQDVR